MCPFDVPVLIPLTTVLPPPCRYPPLPQLLTEMDGMNAKKTVFIIGATNRCVPYRFALFVEATMLSPALPCAVPFQR